MAAHSKELTELFKELNTSKDGISNSEATKRIKKYGYNELMEFEKISPIKIFFNQFKSVIIAILIFATVISLFLGQWLDASVIFAILILNAVIGFFQEYKAEKAIDALKKFSPLEAKVIREGKEKIIPAREVVPGDIILVEAGDRVAADARLIEAYNLETQEASLTGESTPVTKKICILKEETSLSDRANMIFSGTDVTKGKGKAVVVSTGMRTEFGKIAKMIQIKEEPTPLQLKLKSLGRWIAVLIIFIAIIVFTTGLIFHKLDLLNMFLVSVSLAVAAIPEGLPAVVTICLAVGTQRMLKRNALIRKLPSAETLGSTTVICTDKTGTLTHNQMTVKKLYVNDKVIDVSGEGYSPIGEFYFNGKKANVDNIKLLLKIGLLCNNSSIQDSVVIGDPTEAALIISAAKAGLYRNELQKTFKKIDEIPFESERKMMSVVYLSGKKRIMFTKGAPEKVIAKCTKIWLNGKIRRLDSEKKKEILRINDEFSRSALRVLGFAYKEIVGKPKENDLIFVGLQGMIDPPRKEAKEAVEKCKNAGIKVVVITGDHALTAKTIAEQLGIKGKLLTGEELDKISINQLKEIVEDVSIYARTNPEHKLKIIEALKSNGHIVAMTGDGINDAPALKKADIGIAMGITGTDVAKESADMVLVDDNFASIVNAVEEGRGIYENIRKFFAYLLSGNIGEVSIIFFSMLLLLPLPLNAIQILLINLITDGLPAIALSVDPFEPDLMNQKPRSTSAKIYKGLNSFIVYYPIIMTVAVLSIFWFFLKEGSLVKAQTATFLTVAMFELYQTFSCRSVKYPVFKVGVFKNKALIGAVIISFIITISIVFIPTLHPIFKTTSLSLYEFLMISIIAISGSAYIELSKVVKNKLIKKKLI